MSWNIPAISGVSDTSQVRVVLFVGQGDRPFVHAPVTGLGLATTDASSLTSGTLPNARVSSTLPANKAYRRGNILGTVSESGGTPTGEIIERGSNANGEYVRFADGTQLCTAILDRDLEPTAQGNIFRDSDVANWTFPASFSAEPVCFVNFHSAVTWGNVDEATTTGTSSIICWASTSFDLTLEMSATALGRWF